MLVMGDFEWHIDFSGTLPPTDHCFDDVDFLVSHCLHVSDVACSVLADGHGRASMAVPNDSLESLEYGNACHSR